MPTLSSPAPAPKTAAPWLLSGSIEPTERVDDARAQLDPAERPLGPREPLGFRLDAAYRRFGANGGRAGLTAEHLESARVGLDRHRGAQWRLGDIDTIDEIRHRSATAEDFGARANNEIPLWWRCEGTDGARIVPRRLQPLMAIVWWAYASGRFGVLASTVELGTELGVNPRTIRAWRAELVRLGLLRRGTHTLRDRGGVELAHVEVDRTWRPGKHKRPCDRARNLYRVGPVLEAFAGDVVAQAPGRVPNGKGAARAAKRSASRAAGALRRAARVAAYRRTGEVWERDTVRGREPSTTPARRGPQPVSPERMARTVVRGARDPQPIAVPRRRKSRAASRSSVIGRIKTPCTPDPIGPSVVRGLGPRCPTGTRGADAPDNAVARTASRAAPPLANASACQLPPDSNLRPEPRPRRGARPVPSLPEAIPRSQRDADAFSALMDTAAAAFGYALDPGAPDDG